ncbi:hypothetical protein [Magnetospirillum sp. 64-120]|uniref:hypothetical protein n=1 Tax=Magnetospirillum sp. 64-120 TaxID=1895778 RepID=UPI00092BE518|nr:hypothetical protein [Magnetospirillum sp. 64-120]OJX68331.1 MAG: hypothetical protein BGO92_06385 [Magnetospirillum sp. 64-120]
MANTIVAGQTALNMAKIALKATKEGLSEEKLERLKKKHQEGVEALDKVLQARKQARSDRKAAARQKLEELKKRIQMLKMLAAGSKDAARELARLARELKGAARDYRSTEPASDITTSTTTAESHAAERDAEAKADKEFATEVKRIGQLLKSLLKRRQPEDDEEKRGLDRARKDLQSADDDASAITTAANGGVILGEAGLLV